MQPIRILRFVSVFFALAGGVFLARAAAQRPPEQLDSAAILHRFQKLSVLGSVLYIAAHPDDENTRLISYLSNGRQVRTAYLSLTRGDGGQNLIGPELGAPLGVLRTQELLEARRIDGGEQYFTRAVDFGYSKNPEETFAKWGREAILSDVVRVVRHFRPDVIITRFATDGTGGHGHHTASAMLAQEAFDLAADASAFPEQLAQGLAPWQAKRLFFNASSWWNSKIAEEAAANPSLWITVDVGGYDALLGASYTEIAGRSRSQHKSQGFGAAETRGSLTEYLRLDRGAAFASNDPFDGMDLSWGGVAGAQAVQAVAEKLVQGYDLLAPERSLEDLAALVQALDALAATGVPRSEWAAFQAQRTRELMLQVCGVVIDATASARSAALGDSLPVAWSAVQRRSGPKLQVVRVGPRGSLDQVVDQTLPWNRPLSLDLTQALPSGQGGLLIDQPYWLTGRVAPSTAAGSALQGVEPVAQGVLSVRCSLRTERGLEWIVDRPVLHKWVDRIDGERARAVVVTPVASIEIPRPVAVFTHESAAIHVQVQALVDDLSGTWKVELAPGWSLQGSPPEVSALRRGERSEWNLVVSRAADAQAGWLRFAFVSERGTADQTMHVIDYDHILPQTWYAPAQVRLVPLDVSVNVKHVGYIDGAGDDVPQALEQLGVVVHRLDPSTASDADLDRCESIVTGIRAYNTNAELARFQPRLLAWVERGGTLLVQYNTSGNDLVLDPRKIGPYPFALTRERVTVEEAPAAFASPEHPLLTTPNRLLASDFEHWVQERGLYFAGELDQRYAAPITWNDPGEKPAFGGLISCEYGQGRFTYTGISLFRQLPAGVPGAYRLLANLIARRPDSQ